MIRYGTKRPSKNMLPVQTRIRHPQHRGIDRIRSPAADADADAAGVLKMTFGRRPEISHGSRPAAARYIHMYVCMDAAPHAL